VPNLLIIIGSTRPGRVGLPVSQWFAERARQSGAFNVEVADLAEINLPFLDEPNHPRLHQYTQEHTEKWSAMVDKADAFVMVTPEYNFGMAAAIKNALDYLFLEWQFKPVGFVSYGGISAGTRAVQMAKQVVTTLKMMPVPEAVTIPFVMQYVDDQKHFQSTDALNSAADTMLAELLIWEEALRPARSKALQAR
jgi:NAD(P)H-dependent FMN reductase